MLSICCNGFSPSSNSNRSNSTPKEFHWDAINPSICVCNSHSKYFPPLIWILIGRIKEMVPSNLESQHYLIYRPQPIQFQTQHQLLQHFSCNIFKKIQVLIPIKMTIQILNEMMKEIIPRNLGTWHTVAICLQPISTASNNNFANNNPIRPCRRFSFQVSSYHSMDSEWEDEEAGAKKIGVMA